MEGIQSTLQEGAGEELLGRRLIIQIETIRANMTSRIMASLRSSCKTIQAATATKLSSRNVELRE